MYNVVKIEHLAKVYVESAEDKDFELLLDLLIPVIDIQLGKKYPDHRGYWGDMKQEVLLKLWKNRKGLLFTSSEKLYLFLYRRIFRDLFRAMKKIKKDYMEDERLNIESLDVRKHEGVAENIWS